MKNSERVVTNVLSLFLSFSNVQKKEWMVTSSSNPQKVGIYKLLVGLSVLSSNVFKIGSFVVLFFTSQMF